MVAISEKQTRIATIALAVIAVILAAVLLLKNQGGMIVAEEENPVGIGGAESPLTHMPIKNHRLPPAITGASTMPLNEESGEILTREQYEADLRAAQQRTR